MTKIFIITQNEPFYIPKMIEYINRNKNSNIDIVGFTVLKPHRKNKSIYHWFMVRAKIYSFYELLIVFFAMVFVKLYGIFSAKFSVKKTMITARINHIASTDINSNDYINKVKALNIDIIISISSPHLFKEYLLAVPKLGCLNAHGTLLPRHRGVFGSWWTLFEEDKEAGGTIHTMELKLDAGKILWQQEFDVSKDDTQYSIAYKTKKMMAVGLLDVMQNFSNKINMPIVSEYKSSYHRAPTKSMGKLFHSKGKKVLILRDLKYMLIHKL